MAERGCPPRTSIWLTDRTSPGTGKGAGGNRFESWNKQFLVNLGEKGNFSKMESLVQVQQPNQEGFKDGTKRLSGPK